MTVQNTYRAALTGSFTSSGQSAGVYITGKFAMLLSGGNGTVQLECQFDGDANWYLVSKDASGTAAIYTSSAFAVRVFGEEPEQGVRYRLNCTSWVSGTISYRISQ